MAVSLAQASGGTAADGRRIRRAVRRHVAGQLDLAAGARRATAARPSARTCTWNSSERRSRRPRGRPAGAPGGGSRAAGQERLDLEPVRLAQLVEGRLGKLVEELHVGAQLVGGAGQRTGHARSELVLERREHLAPHPDPGVGRVDVVRVVPVLDALDLASGHGVGAGHVEQRPAVVVEAAAHAGQRPAARAAGQAEQDGLGLVVEGVAEEHADRAEVLRPAGRGRRTAPRAPPPPDRDRRPEPRPGPWRSRRSPARPSARRRARRARPTPPGGRGRRSPRSPAGRACDPRRPSRTAAPGSPARRSTRPARRRPAAARGRAARPRARPGSGVRRRGPSRRTGGGSPLGRPALVTHRYVVL